MDLVIPDERIFAEKAVVRYMNTIIEDITQSILNKNNLQTLDIYILIDTLKHFGIKKPMEISFKDGKVIVLVEDLLNWIKCYKKSPTICKTIKEYEQKLLAIKI